MNVVAVVGARPNFVKIAPLMTAMRRESAITATLVHTGQHYDAVMSQRFFDELAIPAPDVNLEVGSGSHAVQTADVIARVEPVLETFKPDVVLVVGDVNSTLAASITAAKMGIPVAHVEAGLRSFDRSMPEEINRVLTDALSHVLFVTEESGRSNLIREGIAPERIHFVGNVMIDTLEATRAKWETSDITRRLGLAANTPYVVVTLHRPSNTDQVARLETLLDALGTIARDATVVFPVHPRTRQQLQGHHRLDRITSGVQLVEPLGYLDFVALMARARVVLTDSGGIQEETTILGVPCLTLRDNTERPVTVTNGTNRVIGTDPHVVIREAQLALAGPPSPRRRPPLWDGYAAPRIVATLLQVFADGYASAGIEDSAR